MTRKMLKPWIVAAVAVPAVILLTGSASADNYSYDAKVMSGGSCQAYYGGQESGIHKYPTGAFNINRCCSRWISCPTLRDDFLTTGGTKAFWVYISQPSYIRTTCRVREMYPTGGTRMDIGKYRYGSGWMSLDTWVGVKGGARFLYCSLGPRAKLVQYQFSEYNTD